MKVYYVNDENHKIAVFVNDLVNKPKVLDHAEGYMFEVVVPDNCGLFIKKWDGHVLLSWINDPSPKRGCYEF